MIKLLNVSYCISNEKKISVGQFKVDIYDEIENSIEDIIEDVTSKITLKKIKKINITITEIQK